MKVLKNPIFTFLIGIIISGSAVFAVTQINASQVTYTDSNNQEKTVETALNDLYTEANKDILTRLNLSSSKVTYNESYGTRISNRSTTLNLTKGSYLIIAHYNYTNGNTGTDSVTNTSNIVSLNNDNCIRLSGRSLKTYISPFMYSSSTINLGQEAVLSTYVCQFSKNTNLEITSNHTVTENEYNESHIMAQAIKLD